MNNRTISEAAKKAADKIRNLEVGDIQDTRDVEHIIQSAIDAAVAKKDVIISTLHETCANYEDQLIRLQEAAAATRVEPTTVIKEMWMAYNLVENRWDLSDEPYDEIPDRQLVKGWEFRKCLLVSTTPTPQGQQSEQTGDTRRIDWLEKNGGWLGDENLKAKWTISIPTPDRNLSSPTLLREAIDAAANASLSAAPTTEETKTDEEIAEEICDQAADIAFTPPMPLKFNCGKLKKFILAALRQKP